MILLNMGSFKDIGIVISSSKPFSDLIFKVLDIWQHNEIGSVKGNVTAKVESHGVAFYCLIPQ